MPLISLQYIVILAYSVFVFVVSFGYLLAWISNGGANGSKVLWPWIKSSLQLHCWLHPDQYSNMGQRLSHIHQLLFVSLFATSTKTHVHLTLGLSDQPTACTQSRGQLLCFGYGWPWLDRSILLPLSVVSGIEPMNTSLFTLWVKALKEISCASHCTKYMMKVTAVQPSWSPCHLASNNCWTDFISSV